MHTIVQLSDLHMKLDPKSGQDHIFEAMIQALRQRFSSNLHAADLLLITGDVFDSVHLSAKKACAAFRELHDEILGAIGDVPTVIIPGNHDRRWRGFVGPNDPRLFTALRDAMKDRAFVHGAESPFLGAVVPRAYHGLPVSMIAYDSTYLPRGLLSAGGMIRQEDLLHAAAVMEPGDEPVLFLLHHHLVPTPLTDVGSIDMATAAGVLRWGVKRLLPQLIANADKEELTMTALGAGTAISTLHELGRAVLVLHGHKHYATARMLHGMIETQGDVLIVSAGSCGMAEAWNPAANRDAARLWPSFNILELHEDGLLDVEMLSFGYKGHSAGRFSKRKLVSAQKRSAAWDVTPMPLEEVNHVGPALTCNHRHVSIMPSASRERWDFDCVRVVEGHEASPRRYVENVEGIPGSVLVIDGQEPTHRMPRRVELGLGRETRYRLERGLCRTVGESQLVYGEAATPYEWLGLMNRYSCDDVVLKVDGLEDLAGQAFASMTDLGTGIEQPLTLKRTQGTIEARVKSCPARTLVRVYIPLTL